MTAVFAARRRAEEFAALRRGPLDPGGPTTHGTRSCSSWSPRWREAPAAAGATGVRRATCAPG